MIRLYLDWNVISDMKNGRHSQLLEVVSNDEKFIKLFSTAHIGDIHGGYTGTPENEIQTQDDLEFLSRLTADWCIYNNSKDIVVEAYSPFSLFEQRKEPLPQAKPFDLADLADNPELSAKAGGYNELLDRPLDGAIRETLDNPVSAAAMQQFYPGLRSDMTYGDLIRIAMERFKSMNEEETYKSMRQMLQQGLNVARDRLFDDKDPFQMIGEMYKAMPFSDGDRPGEKPIANVAEWYGKIVSAYLQLDMHGYQEDKVSVGRGRTQTFRNVSNDAFHAGFASTCDFYVTSDKRASKKTTQVYGKLGINTLVLTPEEFMVHYQEFLSINDPAMSLTAFLRILREGDFVEQEDETHILKTSWLQHFLFDHFTRVHILYTKETNSCLYFLSKDKPTNGPWTFTLEIEQVMRQLGSLMGEDMDGFGVFGEDDEPDNWRGRRWKLDDHTVIRLAFPNGWLQLYLDMQNEKDGGQQ
jgi:hypothetical protein